MLAFIAYYLKRVDITYRRFLNVFKTSNKQHNVAYFVLLYDKNIFLFTKTTKKKSKFEFFNKN